MLLFRIGINNYKIYIFLQIYLQNIDFKSIFALVNVTNKPTKGNVDDFKSKYNK